MHPLAAIPSPTRNLIHIGPLPIHAYAICIIIGIFAAIAVTTRRFVERGGKSDDIWDIAGWTVVLGIIGGRLYHLITDPELYFEGKPGTSPIDAFKIWDGGLGIWGAIALGFLGAWIGARRHNLRILVVADAMAPGLLLAQAIGRWGNWFNNELFGAPTSLPWRLQIHCLDATTGVAIPGGTNGRYACPPGSTVAGYFHPTFLYECIWNIAVAVVIVWLDRRFRLGRGKVFSLYVMGYTLGRVWIEMLREDHANHILGVRLNVWTSIVVFVGGLAWFLAHGGFNGGREASPYWKQPTVDAENVAHGGHDDAAP